MRTSVQLVIIILTATLTVLVGADVVGARAGLQVQPYLLKETLKPTEQKKGFVDISNPSDRSIVVTPSVKAFRQIDTKGNLEFYDSKEIAAGIIPDLAEFELGPREAVRMYYLVDGRRLPQGDIFAAMLFSTTGGSVASGVTGTAGVGTLLTLVNGTPGSRKLDIDMSQVPVMQIGNGLQGTVVLKNPADPEKVSGFFPEMVVRVAPLGQERTVDGPLLMAGNSRDVKITIPFSRLGFTKITSSAGDTEQSKWLFMLTGWWRWLALPLLIATIVIVNIIVKKARKNLRKKAGKKL